MSTSAVQFEGIVLGTKKDSYLVRLVDLVNDRKPDMKSLMRKSAFPEQHRRLPPGALFFWTVDNGQSQVLVSDVRL